MVKMYQATMEIDKKGLQWLLQDGHLIAVSISFPKLENACPQTKFVIEFFVSKPLSCDWAEKIDLQ